MKNMPVPNKDQSKILHEALADMAIAAKNNNDVHFANELVDFINSHPIEGQGQLGHYGPILEKSDIIREFIDSTPQWLDSIRKQDEAVSGPNSRCTYCGATYKKIEELANELRKIVNYN